ncbi:MULTISPECIES: hypothetical protein [unclassified Microcoleus]
MTLYQDSLREHLCRKAAKLEIGVLRQEERRRRSKELEEVFL